MKDKVGAVNCEFKYSGAATALVLAMSGATLALVLAMPLDAPLTAALAAWLVASAARAVLGVNAVRSLRVDGNQAIRVRHARGGERSGTLRDGSFVAPWLTLVRWRPEGARVDHSLLVLPGMVADEDFRRLRVLLRWV